MDKEGRQPPTDLLPASTHAALARAEIALRAHRDEEALRIVTQVAIAQPEHVGALELLAKIQWKAGMYRGVLTTLGTLIRLNPYEPGYHSLRGAVLQCVGRYGESVRAFARGGDSAGADEAAADLKRWQASIVRSMLAEDPIFRAHYAHDPEAACASRGFEFGSETTIRERWLTDETKRASLFTRPS